MINKMTFDNNFEQMLNDYDIHVSDRTRRLIRRNQAKSVGSFHEVKKEKCTLCVAWEYIRFVLSIIFRVILGIMTGVAWICLLLINKLVELWCFMLIIHVTQTVIRQYQLH
jgi:hypothetical protein